MSLKIGLAEENEEVATQMWWHGLILAQKKVIHKTNEQQQNTPWTNKTPKPNKTLQNNNEKQTNQPKTQHKIKKTTIIVNHEQDNK